MNPFDLATQDIFGDPNFTESATVCGKCVTVIRSAIFSQPLLSDFGRDEGESFALRVQKKDLPYLPKQNDKVVFDGETYRILAIEHDSAGLVINITLKSRSTR